MKFFICNNYLHCEPKKWNVFFFGVHSKTIAKDEKKAKILKKKVKKSHDPYVHIKLKFLKNEHNCQ